MTDFVYRPPLFLVDHDICENPDSYFGSESGEQVIPVTFSLSLDEKKHY